MTDLALYTSKELLHEVAKRSAVCVTLVALPTNNPDEGAVCVCKGDFDAMCQLYVLLGSELRELARKAILGKGQATDAGDDVA